MTKTAPGIEQVVGGCHEEQYTMLGVSAFEIARVLRNTDR